MAFDNGNFRHYEKEPLYSRVVEYNINETEMTIEQVWAYGQERGVETFSGVVSTTFLKAIMSSFLLVPQGIVTSDTARL